MVSDEVYLYLDINGKLDQNFFQKPDIFFKIVNVHKEHPLVQIGNYVFEGSYEDYLGTKVFFIEDENPQVDDNVFVKQTPLHLKYLCKTGKTLQLKWRKVPNSVAHVDKDDMLELQFNENYNTVLKKLEKGQLTIEDIVVKPNLKEPAESSTATLDAMKSQSDLLNDKNHSKKDKVAEGVNQSIIKLESLPITSSSEIKQQTTTRYEIPVDTKHILQELVKEPMRQTSDFQKVYDVDPNLLAGAKNAGNFGVLKQLFLQSLSMKNFESKVDENQLEQYVDIEKSVKDGVISSVGEHPLPKEQLDAILNPDNFDNFTVPMKLTYLIEQLHAHKKMLNKMTVAELNSVDMYERTPKDRYRLLKRLTKDLWYYVYSYYSD